MQIRLVPLNRVRWEVLTIPAGAPCPVHYGALFSRLATAEACAKDPMRMEYSSNLMDWMSYYSKHKGAPVGVGAVQYIVVPIFEPEVNEWGEVGL